MSRRFRGDCTAAEVMEGDIVWIAIIVKPTLDFIGYRKAFGGLTFVMLTFRCVRHFCYENQKKLILAKNFYRINMKIMTSKRFIGKCEYRKTTCCSVYKINAEVTKQQVLLLADWRIFDVII